MIGRTLAHYEITSQLGKGGMGEVYRARDTKLDRDVALKVLPQEMSGDPERKARFEREARSLASLQHPNVASIYGFEEADGVRFLVMELVEGEDLSQRLGRGPVPPAEVRSIAAQIAAGLEAAHDTGLVHRDLKPANIMVSAVGDVKVLDFGLARAWYGDPENDGDPSMSPTITAAMTQAGTVLGTAAYMAPEQARGRKVDRRADIWAFGVILYEMLTGRKLFEGDTISDTMAAVLRAEPDWSALPTEEDPELCHLTERCLQRDPRQRLRDIGEARIMLEPGSATLSSMRMSAVHLGPESRHRSGPVIAAVALLCLAIGAAAGWLLLGGETEPPVIHAMIPPPAGNTFDVDGGSPGPAVISPDGTMICFTAIDEDGTDQLWLRHVDRDEAALISGTLGAAYPFWSPDSEYIGFFDVAEGRLRKVAVRGGPPTTLCTAPNGKGGAWNRDGVIIFAANASDPLSRVMDTGGDPVALTTLEEGEGSHRHPRFLPDQEHYVFLARRTASTTGEQSIQVGRLGSSERRTIANSLSNAEYASGHLLTVRENVLMATPFPAPYNGTPSGGIPIVEGIAVMSQGAAAGVYSASTGGMLVYQTGQSSNERNLAWVEFETERRTQIGDSGALYYPRISPDGKRALVELREEGGEETDLWMVELDSGLRTRFTFAAGLERSPVWSPNGSVIYYSHNLGESSWIMSQPVEGTSSASVVLESPDEVRPTGISPDGKTLLIELEDSELDTEILTLAADGGEEPQKFVSSEGFEGGAVWSPDGRWIAYHTSSAQRFDTFVTAADGSTRKWQVSRVGAVWPQWSSDGRRIYAAGLDGALFEFEVDGETSTFRIGNSKQVARTQAPSGEGAPFALDPTSERILHSEEKLDSSSTVSQLHLVTDWQRGLAGR